MNRIVEQQDGGSSQLSVDIKDLFLMLSARRIARNSWADRVALIELNELLQKPPQGDADAKDWLESMAQAKWALYRHGHI
jgi:hypothetical protein